MIGFVVALAVTVPTFGRVVIDAPVGPPAEVVLFVSGDQGWTAELTAMSHDLRARGALVVGIDLRSLRRGLEESVSCTYPAGDFEELSRNVQLHQQLPSYKRPLLVGYQSGAALAYAAIASAPAETFAGGIGLRYTPVISLRIPLCKERGLIAKRVGPRRYEVQPFAGMKVPWRAVTASELGDAFRTMTTVERRGEPAHSAIPDTSDLSLVEVPATGAPTRDLFAIILTGDGGWAELDKAVADGLASRGVPTVGWSSLNYFWSPKTPEQASADLARVIGHYTTAWKRQRVVLIGYSFGADVLPFLVTRLKPDIRSRIAGLALLGPSPTASFEFHVADWFGGAKATTYQTPPEVARLSLPLTCVQGQGDAESACPSLKGPNVSVVTVGAGHHFGGEYQRLVDVILGLTARGTFQQPRER